MSITIRVANGGIDIDASGLPVMVENEAKAAQELAEVILNEYDAAEDWGSTLHQLTGDPGVVISAPSRIASSLTDAVDRLIRKQLLDGDKITLRESIDNISQLDVIPLNHGRTVWGFVLRVRLKSNFEAVTGFSVDLDQQLPAALVPNFPGPAVGPAFQLE